MKSLSTRWLLPFKVAIYAVYGLLAIVLITTPFTRSSSWTGILTAGPYLYFLYRLIKVTTKIKNVEFDEEYLYIMNKASDVMIPLENIKSVELKTVGGVYRVDLYYEDLPGSFFYFKPSLLYPLNHRSKDELVDLLRKKIDHSKKSRKASPANVLTS